MTAINISHLAPIDCPAPLRELAGWLIWKYEPNDNPGGKPRKVPYYARGGRRRNDHGTPEDRARMVTFDEARAAAARMGFDGVGFAPMTEWGVVALDFDNCVEPDGTVREDIALMLSDTYAELSPSGHGVRAFYLGNLGDRKSGKGWPFGLETFSSKGYVTFTGNALPSVDLFGTADTVAPLNADVMALYDQRFRQEIDRQAAAPEHQDRVGLDAETLQRALDALPDDLDYDQWLTVGMAVHHETGGQGFELWDEWSRKSPKYTTPEYGWDRWRSFDRATGPVVTARSLVHMANEHGAGIPVPGAGPASLDEFETLVEAAAPTETPDKPPRYLFEPVASFASSKGLPWIVKGVLPQAGLAVVYGASGSGKSFAVLDIGMAIARGVAWRGRRVKQGRVAYIAAEGADGFRKRAWAYAQGNEVDLAGVPFVVLNAAPNLMDKKDAVDVVAGIRAAGGADVVIVDTFAQTTPGANENAGEDMGKALAHCKRIHEVTGALVVLIHHSGKDATKGARGWSGLRAAADAEIEVIREGDLRALRLTKNKDGEDGLEWGFSLEVVQLGMDDDLDPITSCVVREAHLPVGVTRVRKMGKVELIVNEVIQEVAASQTSGIEVQFVVSEAARRLREREGIESDPKGNAKTRARKALNSLCDGDDAPYWLDHETNCIEVI